MTTLREHERQRLEYRPRLRYAPDLRYLAAQERLPGTQADSYKTPTPLEQASEHLGSDALDAANSAKQAATDLANQLANCLSTSGAGPISYGEYAKAVQSGDHDAAATYEQFHRTDPAGKVQLEAMLASQRVAKEADQLAKLITTTLFPGREGEPPSDLHRAEVEEIEMAIRADMRQPGGDMMPWTVRAQTARVMREQADGLMDFVGRLEGVCRSTTASQFFGQIEPVVATLASSPAGTLPGMEALARRRFDQAVGESERARLRTERLDTAGMRGSLTDRLATLQTLHRDAVGPLKDWMKGVETEWDTHPITPLLDSTLTQMEQVTESMRGVLVDLHKVNVMASMGRSDWADALLEKKKARQIIRLTQDMAHDFDFADPGRDRQVRRFIENHRLDRPGNLCSE